MHRFYTDVPGIGNVAVRQGVLDELPTQGFTQEEFEKTLFEPNLPDYWDHFRWWRKRGEMIIMIEPFLPKGPWQNTVLMVWHVVWEPGANQSQRHAREPQSLDSATD